MSFSSDFRQTVTKLQLHGTDRPNNSSLLQHQHSCPKPISFNQIQTKYYPKKKNLTMLKSVEEDKGNEEGKEKNSKPISFNQIQTKYYKN